MATKIDLASVGRSVHNTIDFNDVWELTFEQMRIAAWEGTFERTAGGDADRV
jgi:hypothetical protein